MGIISIISSMLNTKWAKLSIFIVLIVLIVLLCIQYFSVKSLEKELDKTQSVLLERESEIDDLNKQLKQRKFEIDTLMKGISIADTYHSKTEEVLNHASDIKTEIINEALSNEESKDWWNTEIPSNILNMLTCNKPELL